MSLDQQWLESNKFRSYPFEDGTYSLLAPFQNEDPNSLFLDARLIFKDPLVSNLNNRVWGLDSLSLPSFSLQLKNNDTGQVLDLGTPQFNSLVNSARTLQWIDSGQTTIVLLILNNDHPVLGQSGTLQFSSLPLFVPRVIEAEPRRIDNLKVDDILWASSGSVGDIVEGNNISLKLNPDLPITEIRDLNKDPLRPSPNRIVINAKPGLGLGQRDVDCFPSITDILTINNISGKKGNFFLLPDNCYRIMQPVDGSFNPLPAKIKIENDCLPCCDCADFADMLEDIRTLVNEGLEIKAIWDQTRTLFEEIKTIWQDKFSCLGANCLTQLFAYSFTGWIITVQVWIGNIQDCIQDGGSVTITFSGGDIDALLIPNSGLIYSAEGSYIQVDPLKIEKNKYLMSDNSPIKGGGYRLFVFSVRLGPTPDRTEDHGVQVDAEISACNNPNIVTLTKTVALKGNVNKE